MLEMPVYFYVFQAVAFKLSEQVLMSLWCQLALLTDNEETSEEQFRLGWAWPSSHVTQPAGN